MLIKTGFKPGIVKDDSALMSSTTYIDGDKIRFRLGQPEVIGGWEKANLSTFTNPCRGVHSWAALSGDKVRAFGTASNLYTLFGGSLTDITPEKYRGTLTDPFTTESGSKTVIVAHTDHGAKLNDTVTYALADAVGGLTINGSYTISRIRSLDAYEITAGSNASSSATGGGNVETVITLDTGLIDGVGGTGYGTGTYGTGGYGVATGGDIDPRVWSCDNWGNDGVFVPRNGAFYEYQPSPSYAELTATSPSSWVLGTGWVDSGGGVYTASAASASDLSLDMTAILSGGLTYEIVVTTTVSAGTVQFKVTSADTGDESIGTAFSKAGTYTRRFTAPSNPTTIKFSKDAAFAGTISALSIKLASKAYRIQSAPQYSIGMFTDPNRIAVCYGTVQYNGVFNPMCVRWSAQEDNTDWTPSDTNLSGEFLLSVGSRIVGAVVTRGQNIIFTDEAAYSMQFTGDTGSVFSFNLIGTGCGLAGKNAVDEHNGWVFWLGSNGQFYVYRGGEPQIIECPVRRDVTDNLAVSQNEKIFCGVNSKFNEVKWLYADSRDGNECSREVVYNWIEDHWTQNQFAMSAWLRAGIDPYPMGFWTTGEIYYHEKGNTANGSAMTWHLQTGYLQVDQGGHLMAITKYYPDYEMQVGNINLYLYIRNWPNETDRIAGPYLLTTSTADVNLRQVGREVSIRWESGTNSNFMRLGVQAFDVTQTGMSR